MKKAILYGRVSTAAQADVGTSLESQYLVCRRKADDMGAAVVAVFEDAVSGSDYATRDGLQNALRLIEAGEADTLIIYDMSRYSRDAIHQQQILKRVLAAGGKLVFTTFDVGDLSDNPESRLAFGVHGVFAEYERLKIRSRMMQGKKRKAEQGYAVTPFAPFGYEIATKPRILAGKYKLDDHKKFFLVEPQATIAREIFTRYAAGESAHSLCTDLAARGIPSPRGATQWKVSTLTRILRNQTYIGTAHFGKYKTTTDETLLDKGYKSKVRLKEVPEAQRTPLQAPALVSLEVWQECQRRLAENQARLGGQREYKYLLTSLLRCAVCGGKCYGKPLDRKVRRHEKGEFEYACQKRAGAFRSHNRCHSNPMRSAALERAVLREVLRQLADPDLLTAALQKQEAVKVSPPQKVKPLDLHKRLRELEKREAATVQAQINALQKKLNSAVYEKELASIITERDALQGQLKAIEKERGTPKRILSHAHKLSALFAEFAPLLDDEATPVAEKREILMQFMEAVTVRKQKSGYDVSIKWRGMEAENGLKP